MATLVKEHEGIIYSDTFNESSLIWSLTPSNVDCLRFDPDGLQILHNSEYVTYTMKELEDSYCMIVKLEHTPITEDDIGGIIVMSTTDNYAECQTYLAIAPSTIGNHGANITFEGDFGLKYVRYTIDNEGESDEESGSSSSDSDIETVMNGSFKDIVYKYIKVLKLNQKVKNTYQFFASPNGKNWIEVGNTEFDQVNSIGFFLYAVDDKKVINNGKFKINRLHLYENQYITIRGINIFQSFEIIDRDKGTILRSDTTPGINIVNYKPNEVQINTNSLFMPITNAQLRVYQRGFYNNTIATYLLPNLTFGGDIFSIHYDIELYIDNERIYPGNTYDLGMLYKTEFKRNIVVYNNEDFALNMVKISVVKYSEYYSGEEAVGIAFYDGNKVNQHPDSYNYQDSLTIPEIESHTGVELIVKLTDIPKQEFYSVSHDYRFKILIE